MDSTLPQMMSRSWKRRASLMSLSPEAGEKTGKIAAWCATGFFVLVVALNVPGYIELFRFIGQ